MQETEIPNLAVLTAGQGTLNSANLLYGSHARELLHRFSEELNTVLIDTPPVLHIPDARVWGRMADAAILVIRADKTTRDAALAARHRLSEDGTRILGTILNDWNPKRHGYGYYGYYKGYYRKGYGRSYTAG